MDLGFDRFTLWVRPQPRDEEAGYEAIKGREVVPYTRAVKTVMGRRSRFVPYVGEQRIGVDWN